MLATFRTAPGGADVAIGLDLGEEPLVATIADDKLAIRQHDGRDVEARGTASPAALLLHLRDGAGDFSVSGSAEAWRSFPATFRGI